MSRTAHLEHVELVVLVAFEAVCHRAHRPGCFAPEVQQRRLVVGEHVGEHVAARRCQEVDLLHRVQLEAIEPRFRLLHLRLDLNKTRVASANRMKNIISGQNITCLVTVHKDRPRRKHNCLSPSNVQCQMYKMISLLMFSAQQLRHTSQTRIVCSLLSSPCETSRVVCRCRGRGWTTGPSSRAARPGTRCARPPCG